DDLSDRREWHMSLIPVRQRICFGQHILVDADPDCRGFNQWNYSIQGFFHADFGQVRPHEVTVPITVTCTVGDASPYARRRMPPRKQHDAATPERRQVAALEARADAVI